LTNNSIEIVWVGVGWPGTVSYRGFDRVRAWFRDLVGALESFESESRSGSMRAMRS
jgi:hypothetical protein